MKKHLAIFAVLSIITIHTSAQESYQLEEIFYDAQSWFYYEDYKEALPIYLRLNKIIPHNNNINYKIGLCYLNIPGEKTKAIPFLKKAAQNTTKAYNKDSYYEKKAPIEAHFYLGNAYLINNEINKALRSYSKFKKLIQKNKNLYDLSYVERQIQSCNNAKNIEDSPINYIAYNLGEKINSQFSDFNPVVSGDESTLIFNSSLKFYDAVFWSIKKNGQWQHPINIIPQLGVDDKCYSTCLSYDGKELYLYKIDDFDGNIYVSFYKNGRWSNVQKLNENINTKYWESHASLSSDGKKLYFTSNRKGGYGDLDIYVSEKNSLNNWGQARNLGKIINTPYNETTPFITNKGKTLFFSSEGHFNIGGYDIFYSYNKGKMWSEPFNIGYPINTTDDNTFFTPVQNGQAAYYAQFSNQGFGKMDIYRLKMLSLDKFNHINVDAVITFNDEVQRKVENFEIIIVDTIQYDTIAVLHPETDRVDYIYKTLSGKNHLIFETPRTEKNLTSLFISKAYNIKEKFSNFATDILDLPLVVDYRIPDNNDVKVKLSLNNNNELLVETFVEGTLINSEIFEFEEGVFIYDYKPTQDKSSIKLKQIGRNNKITNKDFIISYIPDGLPEEAIKKILEEKKSYAITEDNNIMVKLSLKKEKLTAETYLNTKPLEPKNLKFKNSNFTYEFSPSKNILLVTLDTLFDIELIQDSIRMADSIAIQQIKNYISQLTIISEGEVKEVLEQISTDSVKFETQEELIDYLVTNTQTHAYKPVDLILPLVASEISKNKNIEQLINELALIAEEGLKDVLQKIKTDSISITNIAGLIKYLNKETDAYNYSSNDITNLILVYALNKEKNINKLVKKLLKVTKNGLHEFISSLNPRQENLSTPFELVNYLLYRSIDNNYTETDVLIAVLKLTALEDIPVEEKQEFKPERKGLPIYAWIIIVILLLILTWIIRRYLLEKKKTKQEQEQNLKNQ